MKTQEHKTLKRTSIRSYSNRAKRSKIIKRPALTEVTFDDPALSRTCLLFRIGAKYYQINHRSIAYIYTSESVNVLVTKAGKRFPIELSMIKLMDFLDKKSFTRMAKDLIASIDAIKGLACNGGTELIIKILPDLGLHFTYDHRYNRKSIDCSPLP